MELTLIDSTVSGNTAVGVGALSGLISGGGVYLAQGSASLTNATISGKHLCDGRRWGQARHQLRSHVADPDE